MGAFEKLVDALGASVVADAAVTLTPRHLRVLAYHGVRYVDAFDAQVRHLRDRYEPVTADAAIAAADGADLPTRSVWLTFDDGHVDVVDHALRVLVRHGVEATMFICPGIVDTDEPYWWTIVEQAEQAGLSAAIADTVDGRAAVTALKLVPDSVRRAEVARLARELAARGRDPARPQLDRTRLARWLEAGMQIGNHTWDHPCLDMCDAQAQRAQVRRAHAWLAAEVPSFAPVFAYPNGNWAPAAADELARNGYRIGLLFDHRLTRVRSADPQRWSRLRVSADAPLSRFSAIVSGAHAVAAHVARRAR